MATPANGNARLRFGTFELDLAGRELFKRGAPVHLQDKPFQILALLLERPGEIVTREELQRRLWPNGTFVEFDKGLNTAVKKLRQALLDSADSPIYVETLPRRGYRFIAPIQDDAYPESNGKAGSINGGGIVGHNGAGASSQSGGSRYGFKQGYLRRPSRGQHKAAAIVLLVALAGAALLAKYRPWGQALSSVVRSMSLTRLTQNGKVRYMAISPDGEHVSFALEEGITQSLWIREVRTGSELQLLGPETVNFAGLEFSPDGKFVYFARSEKTNPVFGYMCRISATGGPAEKLIKDADSPVSFSPDGKRFVYTRGYPPRKMTEVRMADRDGANDEVLLALPGHEVYDAGATWSPNGDVVAVPIRIPGKETRFVLYAISLASRRATELYSRPEAIGRPMWLNAGRELLVTLKDGRTHRGQLWTLSYPGGEAKRVTNDFSDYSSAIGLTKDQTRLATLLTNSVSNVWVANADEKSRAVQMTSGEPSLFEIRELPDGRLLARGDGVWTMEGDASQRRRFGQIEDADSIETCGRTVLALSNKDGSDQLTRYRIDGSGAAAVVAGDIFSPVCSPDEKSVYYVNFAQGDWIERISTADGTTEEVAKILGDTVFGNLTISPDGKLLAYPYQQYEPPLVAIAVISSTGGRAIKQFRMPGFLGHIRWSPNGDALQYLQTKEGATNLWEQRLDGGEAKPLTHFTVGEIFDFDWSHDGKRLLFTRGQVTRDVVLLENFQGAH